MKLYAASGAGAYAVSCPSRGTWIEIRYIPGNTGMYCVVPLAGHVD